MVFAFFLMVLGIFWGMVFGVFCCFWCFLDGFCFKKMRFWLVFGLFMGWVWLVLVVLGWFWCNLSGWFVVFLKMYVYFLRFILF